MAQTLMHRLKRLPARLAFGFVLVGARTIVALVLLATLVVICALLPFVGTAKAGQYLTKIVDSLIENPL